ncbi:glycosyltransferase family 32 protein [Calocera viscosa TUFC12733]|uniref:Glycosyltransferase family 32 protein n=1 Tax=Calocera viscosa (strain TUFC12733) TaxID=1330018 RepID=A0A167KD41_CALVF|nr:glycosyltransferase family 32 protein [Calocera viscosa TUFC12733]
MPSASINTLPVELVRYIIRLATDVPVVFDTSSESVLDEDRDETRRLILESIKTKSSLSVVSKLFHILVDEYLYEILLLTKFPGCKSLRLFAAFLKTKRPGGVQSHGERIRRLELHFHIKSDDWTTSWDSLWGLILACPNLELLVFQPQRLYNYRGCHVLDHDHGGLCLDSARSQWTFNCSETFARNISRHYGGLLRRLEIGGGIRFPLSCLQPMLACMRRLEVLYIRDVDRFLWVNPNRQWTGTLPMENQMKHLHTLLLQPLPFEEVTHASPQLRHVSVNHSYFLNVDSFVRNLLQQNVSSIISLYYDDKSHISLPLLLETLPNLEHLRLQISEWADWYRLLPAQPYTNLRIITLFWGLSASLNMKTLLELLEEGRLPYLKKIRHGDYLAATYHPEPYQVEALGDLGITWEKKPKVQGRRIFEHAFFVIGLSGESGCHVLGIIEEACTARKRSRTERKSCPPAPPPPQPRASLNTHNVQVVHYILRLATDVPFAFDTSWSWVLDEDRERTGRLITQPASHSTSRPPSSLTCISRATSPPSPPFPQHNTTTFPAPSRDNTVPPLVHTIYHLSGTSPPRSLLLLPRSGQRARLSLPPANAHAPPSRLSPTRTILGPPRPSHHDLFTPPQEVYGHRLSHFAHKADVLRLQLLIAFGGIYVDIDTYVLRSFDRAGLMTQNVALGMEASPDSRRTTLEPGGLCNAIIVARREAPFLKRWLRLEYHGWESLAMKYLEPLTPSLVLKGASSFTRMVRAFVGPEDLKVEKRLQDTQGSSRRACTHQEEMSCRGSKETGPQVPWAELEDGFISRPPRVRIQAQLDTLT